MGSTLLFEIPRPTFAANFFSCVAAFFRCLGVVGSVVNLVAFARLFRSACARFAPPSWLDCVVSSASARRVRRQRTASMPVVVAVQSSDDCVVDVVGAGAVDVVTTVDEVVARVEDVVVVLAVVVECAVDEVLDDDVDDDVDDVDTCVDVVVVDATVVVVVVVGNGAVELVVGGIVPVELVVVGTTFVELVVVGSGALVEELVVTTVVVVVVVGHCTPQQGRF